MHSISIVLPCYNEELAIPKVVSECVSMLNKDLNEMAKVVEVIVVDDGSKDNSYNELLKFSGQIKILQHSPNQGYGAAIKTGIKSAKGNLIAVFDLDCTCSVFDLDKLVIQFVNQSAEMAVGQRLSNTSGMPIVRSIGNWIFSTITKFIFNSEHHDVCSGYRLFNKNSISAYLNALNDDLSFCLGASLKFLIDQRKIVSVPIDYKERAGESKLSALKEGPQFLAHILSQWIQQWIQFKAKS